MEIITDMLDNDLYKLSMQNAVCALYPRAWARYTFINRGGTEFPDGFRDELERIVDGFSNLALTKEEEAFLKEKCPYLNPVYIDFLRGYRYDPSEVHITDDNGLTIVVEGPWYRTIMWEVPLMALISELYFLRTGQAVDLGQFHDLNAQKGQAMKEGGLKVADFGTRRRYSKENQGIVVADLMNSASDAFVGTSNVHFARIHGIKAIGTQAHEWFQAHAAMFGFKMANEMALNRWAQVYKGDLGIALSDTFTSTNFFESFDKYLAKLFDGVRQDSGDPYEFADAAIEHYLGLGIDPISKTMVFSDSLTVDKAIALQQRYRGRIKTSFGIGTHLTNDVGVKALNMVIKLTGFKPREDAEWVPTVKLSDDVGKHTGNEEMIDICKKVLGVD